MPIVLVSERLCNLLASSRPSAFNEDAPIPLLFERVPLPLENESPMLHQHVPSGRSTRRTSRNTPTIVARLLSRRRLQSNLAMLVRMRCV